MDRRRFLLASLAGAFTAPLATEGQQTLRIPRIGVLLTVDLDRTRALLSDELRRLGYVEGRTVVLDFRLVPPDQAHRLPDLAAEMVQLKADVIIAQFTPAALAAKAATARIPVVMAPVGNPVETGLIASLARPGGNITGVAGVASELGGKTVQLLREALPSIRRLAALLNAKDPFAQPLLEQVQLAARSLAFDVQPVRISGDALEGTFAQLIKDRIEAIVVQPSLPTRRAATLAVEHRLPIVSFPRWFAEEGGLMAYGWDTAYIVHEAAIYVHKILRGAKPADLPVEQPTKFELVINLKTAKALGLTIPPSLLARADQVIE